MQGILPRPLNVLLLGAPGVGKGSFGQKLAPHFGIPIFSTGDFVRAEIKTQSALGKQIQEINARGELVSDDIIMNMVKSRLAQDSTLIQKGFIMDGSPRTIPQAKAFEAFPEKLRLNMVLNFTIDEEVLVTKTCSRRVCAGCGRNYNLANINKGRVKMTPLAPKVEGTCDDCKGKLIQRADDTEEVVTNRLKIYNAQTLPLVQFYQDRGLLVSHEVIKGMKDLPEVIKLIEQFRN
jgi:adenylate kinase